MLMLVVLLNVAQPLMAEPERPPPPSDWLPSVEYRSERDIGLVARVHFATHTPDFDRSRASRASNWTVRVCLQSDEPVNE